MSNDKSTGTHFNSLKVDSIDTNTNEHQSLFEEKGFIDLAKGKNDIVDWKDYKLDTATKDGKTFVLNNNDKPVNENGVIFTDFKNFQKIDTNTNKRSLSIDDLVKFTSKDPKNPQMKLEYQDFAYCSRLGFYPNNRLVVLRRFAGPIGDNLYQKPPNHNDTDDIILRPISTMVTWQKPEDSFFTESSVGFNLTHESHVTGFYNTIKQSYTSFTSKTQGTSSSTAANAGWVDSLTNEAINVFLKAGEKTNDSDKKIDGTSLGRFAANNPNMINTSQKQTGITSTLGFSLIFEYEMRYISGIDPTLAMMDIMANSMRMGTNESEFRYNVDAMINSNNTDSLANAFYKLKYNNTSGVATQMLSINITSVLSGMLKKVEGILGWAGDTVKSVFEEDKGKSKEGFINKHIAHIFDRYREDLKASITVDTGLPNGSWHVMIGDPQNPFISCGDLILKSSKINFGKELGVGGFPTSFNITYTLDMNRPRGRQELMRIFNAGRGRVYTYKKADDNKDYGIY